MSDASDEELAVLARTRTGEAAMRAFEELVSRLERALFGFLYMRVGNTATAEELVQETFLRAWRKLHLFDERYRFSTWIFTLARRLAVSRARVRHPDMVHVETLAELQGGADPAAEIAQREESSHVWRVAREVLAEESCSALWLRYGEELSNAEIGRILGRRTVTVRVILFRARETLARALAPDASQARGTQRASAPTYASMFR